MKKKINPKEDWIKMICIIGKEGPKKRTKNAAIPKKKYATRVKITPKDKRGL